MVFHTRDAVATRAMRWRPALVLRRARAAVATLVSYFPPHRAHRNLAETAPKPHRNLAETAPKPHRNRTETAPKPHRNLTETSPPRAVLSRRPSHVSHERDERRRRDAEMRDAAAMFSGFASLNFSRSSALRLPYAVVIQLARKRHRLVLSQIRHVSSLPLEVRRVITLRRRRFERRDVLLRDASKRARRDGEFPGEFLVATFNLPVPVARANVRGATRRARDGRRVYARLRKRVGG